MPEGQGYCNYTASNTRINHLKVEKGSIPILDFFIDLLGKCLPKIFASPMIIAGNHNYAKWIKSFQVGTKILQIN